MKHVRPITHKPMKAQVAINLSAFFQFLEDVLDAFIPLFAAKEMEGMPGKQDEE